tara:strand:+ start:175 stop:552 length:378 start_codon:yes stop_codon:yes gene_type:complete
VKEIITTKNSPQAIGPYSQAVLANGTLYSSGQIAIDPQTNLLVLETIEAETHQVMKNLRAVFEAAKMDFSNLVKCTIFLKDMNQYSSINEVYKTYFNENPPAREAVQVSELPKGVNVEISAIGVK